MHPNRKFHLTERDEMAALAAGIGFGAVIVAAADGLRAVHVPFLLDGDRVRFHVSRGNAAWPALADGGEALLLVEGPHAYISPDWYGLEGRVPTWNYVAVELAGPVRALDREALVELVDGLSAANEARLAPKPAWTKARMDGARYEALLNAIAGFELHATAWRGTAKLDQDKPPEVRARLAAALSAQGEAAMADSMTPDTKETA
jgi:transcriptional regulator